MEQAHTRIGGSSVACSVFFLFLFLQMSTLWYCGAHAIVISVFVIMKNVCRQGMHELLAVIVMVSAPCSSVLGTERA